MQQPLPGPPRAPLVSPMSATKVSAAATPLNSATAVWASPPTSTSAPRRPRYTPPAHRPYCQRPRHVQRARTPEKISAIFSAPEPSARSSAPPAASARHRDLRIDRYRVGCVCFFFPLPLPFLLFDLCPQPAATSSFFFLISPSFFFFSPILLMANGDLRLDGHCLKQNQLPSLPRPAGSRAGTVGAPQLREGLSMNARPPSYLFPFS